MSGVEDDTFSLVRLLTKFAHLESTDPRDQLYGLLGLVTYTFVKADYEKSVLDIAMDLVKFHCLFDTPTQRWDSSQIAHIITRALGLEEAQFAAHILKRCSWLHTRLHILAPHACILAPVRHVSTVTLAGCRSSLKPHWNLKGSRISSLQLTNTRKNVESKGLWFTESAPNLISKAANPNLLRLLSLRSVPGLVVFANESISSPDSFEFISDTSETMSLGGWMKVGTTYRDEWIGIDNAIDQSKEEKGKVLYTDASCTSFVGTNGFYGITLDQVEPFDCAFVFAGTESTKVVLLLRPIPKEFGEETEMDWKVVGTAVLFAQELVSDATWVEPLPDERTDSKDTTHGSTVEDLASRVYEGVQLKMHPYHMEEFVRCGLLESTIPC